MNDLAIIGMSCLFPDAENYDQFFDNLLQGKNSIQEIPPERFDIRESYSSDFLKKNKTISKWAGLLKDIQSFDHQFFDILPAQAENMDPQCRLLLQEVWHCLEDASVKPETLQKFVTSTYIGFFSLDHFQYVARKKETDMYGALGNYPCMLANRISHFLDLRGPSIAIDSACASSFSALHHAKLALLFGGCDYSIIGGVNLISHVWHHISMSKCCVLSPEGQCKTFDASADGYVRGEGVGCLLVTTLKNAVEQGHHIHALIKGSSINHSGTTPSISTPNVKAQQEMISLALKDAGITSNQIGYLETHGTGTALGDAIECKALAKVYADCDTIYIGSVKTNIGHLEAASGIAGIIKGVMMLKSHLIPKHLNCQQLNPLIDFESTPFKIPFRNEAWLSSQKERFLGVSSMGFGGVNGHVILKEYQCVYDNKPISFHVAFPLLFSAKSMDSLTKYLSNWEKFVCKKHQKLPHLKDVSHTLCVGRVPMNYRAATIAYIGDSNKNNLFPKQAVASKTPSCIVLQLDSIKRLPEKELHLISSIASSCEEKKQSISIYNSLKSKREKTHFETFFNVCLIAKAYLKLGISPNLIIGRRNWQIAALYITEALDLHTAAQLFFSNKQEALKITPPKYPIYQESSQLIYYPYEVAWTAFQRDIKNNTHLNRDLYTCIQKLLPHQFALKKQIHSQGKLLRKYHIDLEEVLNQGKASKQIAPFINLAMLLSINYIFRKHQIPSSISCECKALSYLDALIGLNVLNHEEAYTLVQHPENFSQISRHPKYVASFSKIQKIKEYRPSEKLFQYHPIEEKIEIENPQINEILKTSYTISTQFEPGKYHSGFITTLVNDWLEGLSISWESLMPHLAEKARPTPLPGYAFTQHRFWYKVEQQEKCTHFKQEFSHA